MNAEIIRDMREAEYHARPELSSTGSRKLLAPSCPAIFDYDRRNPKPPTKAMVLGKAAHRLALGVGANIQTADYPDFRTKEAQQWRDAVLDAGDVPLLENSNDWRTITGMRDALRDHDAFPHLFDPERGDAEVSLFWTDDETGVQCRARLDFLPHKQRGRRIVVPDYKKAEKVDGAGFGRAAADYGYPMQHDWYLRGVRANGLDADPALVFVAQSPTPPYLVAVHQIPDQDVCIAAARNDAALRIYAQCSAAGRWPGYEGVQRLDMPTWWRIQSEDLLDSLESETSE